jgi:acetolactate synthase I/III small subunit
MKRFVLSVLVNNHSGVLSRVAGLFSRRGYNIDSLSVGETENVEISRMTIVVRGDHAVLEQITKQLEKLIDVRHISELKAGSSVHRELLLIKVSAPQATRAQVVEIADIFKAKIVDVAPDCLTMQITGDQDKNGAFVQLLEPHGILEIVRTGLASIGRGSDTLINEMNQIDGEQQ